ncbi:MAG TPA: asparagine synthase (glutamine-hydrolyzing) [Oligoflexia bacterium]|nr:asparagine synthase (glutamine-hydrolyzing) [Oligoflexia bacterium]HMP47056.1 asparagine synthase (glutamine-hydrolyzing) [Oligoflexia bacterium]
MCGIAGVFKKEKNPSEAELASLVSALRHRGPDSAGFFYDGLCGFGMRRLSIIDVDSGHQPIFNEDKSLAIVFNGEIYNYRELRRALEAKGHNFVTQSDTEVVIHLYEEHGSDAPNYLRGMFCFAIWNKISAELFIARDRFGIKPLFYYENNQGFYFSSEIKSFFTIPEFQRKLDYEAVPDHFTFLYTDNTSTLFDGVRKLAPGHFLIHNGQKIEIKKYYFLSKDNGISKQSSNERRNNLRDALRETVRAHLISDVPLGAYLSGGVDSSLLVALMKEEVGSGIKTFSVGYDIGGEAFDERRFADIVSRHLNTDHREIVITPEMVSGSIEEVLRALDEPFANGSVIPNYFLSRLAREHVAVALSGLGGDEIAGGYERYRGMLLSEKFPLLGSLCSNRFVRKILSMMPDSSAGFPLQERIKRFVEYSSLPAPERYAGFLRKFSSSDCSRMFSRELLEILHSRNSSGDDSLKKMNNWIISLYKEPQSHSLLYPCAYVDLHTYIVEDLLSLSDRTSMAHSLELRVPFIDHILADNFLHIPDKEKISIFDTKVLLKSIAAEFLPKEVIYRRKQGFSTPLNIWFRGSLKPFLFDNLSRERIKSIGVFDPDYIDLILKEHIEEKRNHDEKLFSILSFTFWCTEHGIKIN